MVLLRMPLPVPFPRSSVLGLESMRNIVHIVMTALLSLTMTTTKKTTTTTSNDIDELTGDRVKETSAVKGSADRRLLWLTTMLTSLIG
jgi:hypothetical protein